MADELKAKGNAAFQAKNYEEAITHFTAAIEVDASNHVFFSNRSACFASLGKFEEALSDAEQTIKLKADWPKGYGRKGAALFGKGDFMGAVEAYEEGLKLDADNAMLKSGLESASQRMRQDLFSSQNDQMLQIGQLFAAPGAMDKLASDPRTSALLAKPGMLQRIESIAANPASVAQNFDQDILLCMTVLMGMPAGDGEPMDTASDRSAPAAAEPAAPREEAKKPEPAPAEPEEPKEPEDPEVAARKAKAAALKAEGTAAYKQKDFALALAKYKEAAEAMPEDLVYLLNQGAVYLEMKDFDACVEVCGKAVEVGIDNRADYKTVAKAYARMGKARLVQGNLADSVKWYDKALANHRTDEYLKMKKRAQKALKEKERVEYIDPAKAEEAKERGNELFKKGDWIGAMKEYNEAIKRNPEDGKLYSNRAATYTKLTEFGLALKDCEECIRLEPGFIKGYLRKGNILLLMKKPSEARKAFEKAMEIDPQHHEAQEGNRRAMMAEAGVGMSREERAQQALNDPEVQEILGDPVMQSILQQMQSDPGAVKDHLSNPAIAEKIFKLQQAGILSFGQ